MPQSPIPNRSDRIDLQPDNAISRVYNIDPKTGKPLDAQYEMYDEGGNLVITDGEGNVLFGGLTTFNSLSVENIKGSKRFSKTVTQYDLSSLTDILDFNITELTNGDINTINFIPPVDFPINPNDTVDGGGFGTGVGVGTPGGGFGGTDGSGTPTSILDLLDLINSLRDELAVCNNKLKEIETLEAAIDALKSELDDVIADNEDLVDLVEALQSCKERLERVLTAKNAEVVRLADELARSSVRNANLELEIDRLTDLNNQLQSQNTDLQSQNTELVSNLADRPIQFVDNQSGNNTSGGSDAVGGNTTFDDIDTTADGTISTDTTLTGPDGPSRGNLIPETLDRAAGIGLDVARNWKTRRNKLGIFLPEYNTIYAIITTDSTPKDQYIEQAREILKLLKAGIKDMKRFSNDTGPDGSLYTALLQAEQRLRIELGKV